MHWSLVTWAFIVLFSVLSHTFENFHQKIALNWKEGVGEERRGYSTYLLSQRILRLSSKREIQAPPHSSVTPLCPEVPVPAGQRGHKTGDPGSDLKIMAVSWIIHLEQLAEPAWREGSREREQRELRSGPALGHGPSSPWSWLLKGTNPIFKALWSYLEDITGKGSPKSGSGDTVWFQL